MYFSYKRKLQVTRIICIAKYGMHTHGYVRLNVHNAYIISHRSLSALHAMPCMCVEYRAFNQQTLYLKYKQVSRIYIPYRINAFSVITLWKISLAYKILIKPSYGKDIKIFTYHHTHTRRWV